MCFGWKREIEVEDIFCFKYVRCDRICFCSCHIKRKEASQAAGAR